MLDNVRGGSDLGTAYDGNTASVGKDGFPLRDRFCTVIRSLAVEIRFQDQQYPVDTVFIKKGYIVNAAQSLQYFYPALLINDRTFWPF